MESGKRVMVIMYINDKKKTVRENLSSENALLQGLHILCKLSHIRISKARVVKMHLFLHSKIV